MIINLLIYIKSLICMSIAHKTPIFIRLLINFIGEYI